MSAGIFISHASEDRKIAHTLCDALESRGFKCWIASRDIGAGENFQIAIVRAIRNAKMMLLVFTANSNSSEEMSKELALASQHKLIVLPLRVEDVAPNDAFAYEFSTRQWIDFFADWEWAINQLCIRLASAMRQDEEEAPPLPSAAGPVAAAVAESASPAPSTKAAEAPKPAVETLKMPTTTAATVASATAKPAPTPAAKPVPAPPPVGGKPVGTTTAPEAKKSRAGLFAVAAVAVVVVIGLGVAVPTLLGKKPAEATTGPQIKPGSTVTSSVSNTPPLAQEGVQGSASAASGSAAIGPGVASPAASDASAQLAEAGSSASSAAPVIKTHHKTHAASAHVATSRADLPY